MNDRLYRAFDAVRCEPGRKERLLDYLARQTSCPRRPARSVRRLAPILACVLLLAAGLTGGGLYFTPVSVISVDINPSVELEVNRFDRVISVQGRNADGQALAQTLELSFLPYSDAVERLLDAPAVSQCLEEDGVLSLTVVSSDPERAGQMVETLRACTAGHPNAHCSQAAMEEVCHAHDAGLSYGKYQAFLEAQALDPQLTVSDVQDMTMRELWDLIGQLRAGDSAGDDSIGDGSAAPDPGFGAGHSGHGDSADTGHGHGHGAGRWD